MKTSKIWNLMKTIIFIMFLRGWDIRIQHTFHPKLIKNQTCNPNMFFWYLKSQKIQNSDPKWCPMGDPKSTKNRWKSTLGPFRAPLSASVPHLIAKMTPKQHPRTSKWIQNGLSGDPNGHQSQQNPTPVNMWQLYWFNVFNPADLSNPANPSVLQIPPVHKLPNCY